MVENGFYRHYKGNLYEVIGNAVHTETEDHLSSIVRLVNLPRCGRDQKPCGTMMLKRARRDLRKCGDDVSTVNRQAAVDMLMERASTLRGTVGDLGGACSGAAKLIMQMPSAEPQIIYCKDCVKHNRRIGDFKEMPNGEVIWYWKYNACPLAEFRGKAQGHEFDYQFCAYGERRTE